MEGSVHVCPEGRMEEDMRILLELVLEKKCRRGPMVRCWRERDLLEEALSKQTQKANATVAVTQSNREAHGQWSLADVLNIIRCYFTKVFLKPWAKY